MGQGLDETFREFLERRERELLEDITVRHAELIPKEAELAEIRRAKSALNILPIAGTNVSLSAQVSIRASGGGTPAVTEPVPPPPTTPNPAHWQDTGDASMAAPIAADRHRRAAAAIAASGGAGCFAHSCVSLPSPYEHLTMKELVIKALSGHFPNGATAKQLRDFIRDAWGRDIARENLSPQLSRLRWDKVIGWKEPHLWFLLPQQSAASSENRS